MGRQGTEEGQREWGTQHRHSSEGWRAFSKTIERKEQGLNLVIKILSWPTQHPVQRQSLVSPRMRRLWAIRNEWCLSQTLQKGGNEAQQRIATFPRVFLIRQGARMGLKGKFMGNPFSHHKILHLNCCICLKVGCLGRTAKIHITFSQLLEEFKFLAPK